MSDIQSNEKQQVTIVDIKMPFMSMVIFMVKFSIASIASIPAFMILSVIFMILGAVFGGVFHGLGMGRF